MYVCICTCTHSARMSCQHGPAECAAPTTVCSMAFKRALDQPLTADTADSLPFFVFITHRVGPTVTFDSGFIKEPEMTARAGVNLWHYSVPIELKGNCQGTMTAGSWDSSGSHFGPVGPGQRTIVGGDWEVNKQQVSQQYSPVDTVSSRPRGGSSEWMTVQVAMWLRPSQ